MKKMKKKTVQNVKVKNVTNVTNVKNAKNVKLFLKIVKKENARIRHQIRIIGHGLADPARRRCPAHVFY